MRRKDRQISEQEALEILKNSEYGFLSTVSEDLLSYGIPLNYAYVDDLIYFHFAPEGRKNENIKYNNKVSFCVVGNTKVIPEKFGTLYESVIVFGKIIEVFDDEKQKGLEALLYKYSSNFIEKGLKYIESSFDATRVFKLEIEKLTGKARRK